MYSLLLGFIWIQLVCFITFQYVREKDYKSDSLNEQLQLCNIHILESLNEGLSAEEYTFPDASLAKQESNCPFSIKKLSGSLCPEQFY